MNAHILITSEILLAIVLPLLFLYLKSNWSKRSIIICSSVIPVLWYLTYALIHESSHIVGTYLVGGRIVDYRLIPKFWLGEFGNAWNMSEGYTQTWQEFVGGASPYILDIICISVGLIILHRHFSTNAFFVGLIFMLMVLRPTFEFMSELTGYLASKYDNDYNGISRIIGSSLTWLYIVFSLVFSWASVIVILRRFVRFSEKKNTKENVQ